MFVYHLGFQLLESRWGVESDPLPFTYIHAPIQKNVFFISSICVCVPHECMMLGEFRKGDVGFPRTRVQDGC